MPIFDLDNPEIRVDATVFSKPFINAYFFDRAVERIAPHQLAGFVAALNKEPRQRPRLAAPQEHFNGDRTGVRVAFSHHLGICARPDSAPQMRGDANFSLDPRWPVHARECAQRAAFVKAEHFLQAARHSPP